MVDKRVKEETMTPDEILQELIDDTQMYWPEIVVGWKGSDWEVKLSPTISDVDAVFKYEDVIGLVARFKAELAKDSLAEPSEGVASDVFTVVNESVAQRSAGFEDAIAEAAASPAPEVGPVNAEYLAIAKQHAEILYEKGGMDNQIVANAIWHMHDFCAARKP